MSLVTALEAPLSISNAIKKASRATGVDFSYLLKTAARESAFNKSAKAKTSSAAGLFQFIESTWLKTVKDVGDKFGLNKYTPHIFKTRSGRYYVPNQKLRNEILQLRHNPEISAIMAGAFTQQNSEIVASQVGRAPTPGELYIAHFLGPQGAADLISLAETKPNARADRHFPAAARANRPIFYSRGKPRTISQVYKNLVRSHVNLEAKGAKATAQQASSVPSVQVATSQAGAGARLAATPPNMKTATRAGSPVPHAPLPPGPARQVTPNEQDLKFLTHKVTFPKLPSVPAASENLIGPGVETRIIEAAVPPKAVGLAGQKSAPVVSTKRVAALTAGQVDLANKTATEAPVGSIGTWTTIVHTPSENAAPARTPVPPQPERQSAKQEPVPAARSRRRTRAPRLLEQTVERNAESVRTAARSPQAWGRGDFWDRMGLDGG